MQRDYIRRLLPQQLRHDLGKREVCVASGKARFCIFELCWVWLKRAFDLFWYFIFRNIFSFDFVWPGLMMIHHQLCNIEQMLHNHIYEHIVWWICGKSLIHVVVWIVALNRRSLHFGSISWLSPLLEQHWLQFRRWANQIMSLLLFSNWYRLFLLVAKIKIKHFFRSQ